MELKQYIEPHIQRGGVAITISLDVQGAFDSAWWPAILQRMREAKCPRNLYNLVQDYLKRRKAIITTNKVNLGKNTTKGCPQGSCCGPILWNIQYNPALNLSYTHHTRALAFADDLILMIRADGIREAENIANIEMDKTATWAKNKKIRFNENTSKIMLMTRKRKENNEVAVSMNIAIPQVQTMKYLGIIFDSKLTFREHVNYVADKCKKLIFQLAKSAKLN